MINIGFKLYIYLYAMFNAYQKFLLHEKNYSTHTIKAYVRDIQQFYDFIVRKYKSNDDFHIEKQHIKEWIMSLRQNELNPKTINRKISSLRRYFQYLLVHQKIEVNPCAQIKALKIPKRLPSVVQFQELQTLESLFKDKNLNEFENIRDYAIMELLYQTGMRRSELISLREEDINFINQEIKVLGKGNKERIIPISKGLKDLLLRYLDIKNQQYISANLFITVAGNILYPKALYNIVKKYLTQITTIDKRSPHSLRHSFATHMLDNGADLNSVKSLLGHSSLAATQIYTHNSISKLREIYNNSHPKGE